MRGNAHLARRRGWQGTPWSFCGSKPMGAPPILVYFGGDWQLGCSLVRAFDPWPCGNEPRPWSPRTPLVGWFLGPPARCPFLPLFWEGSPSKIDYRQKGYPYSILSTTGGPRFIRVIPSFPAYRTSKSLFVYGQTKDLEMVGLKDKPRTPQHTWTLNRLREDLDPQEQSTQSYHQSAQAL